METQEDHGYVELDVSEQQLPISIDLGCGPKKKEGCIGLDRIAFPGVDYVLELGVQRWPFEDGSVAEAYSSHCVEHLSATERCHFFNELHRVLAVGATAKIITPHWGTCRAYGDPTHKWPPMGEFFYAYLSREWRLAKAPHTDIAYWREGYDCDFEMKEMDHGINGALANRNAVFRQFAANHYREFVLDMIATLAKR